ncbi:hypothetical protein WMY93_018186 [Mugilogobius chulae]|uniref:Secreted protein n=1 Tax=Mugilogobius chulae TaxID=88201 RepID=A0AAW0NU22_9GOBI
MFSLSSRSRLLLSPPLLFVLFRFDLAISHSTPTACYREDYRAYTSPVRNCSFCAFPMGLRPPVRTDVAVAMGSSTINTVACADCCESGQQLFYLSLGLYNIDFNPPGQERILLLGGSGERESEGEEAV